MVGRTTIPEPDFYGKLVAQAGARRNAAKAAAFAVYAAAQATAEQMVHFDQRLQKYVGDVEQQRALRAAGKQKNEAFRAAEVAYQDDMRIARETARAHGDQRVHW